MEPLKNFFKRKNIEITVKRYCIDAFSHMALGLFSTLLIGTILNTIGGKLGITFLTDVIWKIARDMTGPAIGVAVAYGLQAPHLVLFSSTITGAAGAIYGGQVGSFIGAVVGAEFGKMVSKETKIDIIVTPAVTILTGALVVYYVGPGVAKFMEAFGAFIMYATELQPFLMGILVSVFVGIALTLPISSAAICAALGLTGLAGGAAVAGCCAQMVGFAVMSFPENKWGGLVSQGIGTSMLQMGNIVKNPKIWIAPIVTSAITGPVATCLFHLEMNGAAVSSGMGTCGLVGQIGVYTGWVKDVLEGTKAAITAGDWMGLILVSVILPAVICPIIYMFLKKIGWVKEGDMKLS